MESNCQDFALIVDRLINIARVGVFVDSSTDALLGAPAGSWLGPTVGPMGLTMGQRKAVTKAIAIRYSRVGGAAKGVFLDELCATTGWHRNHARKALGVALRPVFDPAPRRQRTPA